MRRRRQETQVRGVKPITCRSLIRLVLLHYFRARFFLIKKNVSQEMVFTPRSFNDKSFVSRNEAERGGLC